MLSTQMGGGPDDHRQKRRLFVTSTHPLIPYRRIDAAEVAADQDLLFQERTERHLDLR